MHKALGFIPSTRERGKEKRDREYEEINIGYNHIS
jgi:hypothetical protein